jgi:hypothetical protein
VQVDQDQVQMAVQVEMEEDLVLLELLEDQVVAQEDLQF